MKAQPLRFCMVTTFYPPYHLGGDAIFVWLLANELAKQGHHVEVIHCLDAYQLLSNVKPTEEYQDHPNIIVHRLKSSFGLLSPLATQQTGSPFFKSAQIRSILQRGFDVIHYHNISLVGGPKVLTYGNAIKLYTIHEYWLVCPTHLLFKFNQELCRSQSCFLCALIHQRPPQWWRYSGLLETALKHVDTFISPSQFGCDIHQELGLKVPFVHIPNFVLPGVAQLPDKAIFASQLSHPYFLYVGRLEKIKGIQTLIPLFLHYKKAELLIAGRGSFEPELRQLAQGSNNIRFLGYQSAEQLHLLYQKAVAVIVPSICYELFALVILEAFRVGTPVIVRNLGGMPELVRDSGFVYTTEAELLAAREQLLASPPYRDSLGMQGYQAYQKNWTPEIHLAQYLALIEDISLRKKTQPK